jgi:hypothetical protein
MSGTHCFHRYLSHGGEGDPSKRRTNARKTLFPHQVRCNTLPRCRPIRIQPLLRPPAAVAPPTGSQNPCGPSRFSRRSTVHPARFQSRIPGHRLRHHPRGQDHGLPAAHQARREQHSQATDLPTLGYRPRRCMAAHGICSHTRSTLQSTKPAARSLPKSRELERKI